MFLQNHTFEELRTRVLKLLERYSSNGMPNTCGETKDIECRLIESANTHLRKLYSEVLRPLKKEQVKIKKLKTLCNKVYSITSKKAVTWHNTGTGMVFYCKAKGDLTITIESESGSKSYHIDDDGGKEHIIYGTAKNRHDSSMNFKLESATSAEVLEFYGFWGATYAEDEEVEVTTDGIMFPKIPEDCAEIIAIYDSFGRRVSSDVVNYSVYTGRLYANAENYGEYTVEYIVLPQEITSCAAGEEIIRLPSVLFDALCYMCASDICPANDGNVFSKLTYKYREILENYYSRSRSFVSGRNSFFTLTGRIKK